MKTSLSLFALTIGYSLATHAVDLPRENHVEALTLEQAFDLAERLQPELAEAKALIEAADGRAKQAGVFPNPTALARMESARLAGRPTAEAEYLAGISQPIPLGNRLSKARQAEQLERDRRAHELEVRRRDLRKRVHSTFATALYQEQAFQLQEKLVASWKRFVETTKARVEAGDIPREELARAEIELLRAEVELKRSHAMRKHALVELKGAMGDPDLAVKTLSGTLDETFELPALEALVSELSSSPEILSADAGLRVRQAQVDLAKAERIPEVRVEALYRRLQASEENSFDVGLSIPIPLFDRGQGRLRAARAEVAAAEARLRSTRNTLSVRLHEAHAQLTSALAASRTLKTEVLPRADRVLAAHEARFEAGDVSLAELLPVRRDWAAVQLTYLESLREVMQAWAEVRSLTGWVTRP